MANPILFDISILALPGRASPYLLVVSSPVAIPVAIFLNQSSQCSLSLRDAKRPHSTGENAMMRALVLSAMLVGGAGPFCASANELPDESAVDRQVSAAPGHASIPARTARHHGTRHHRMYMMSVNCTHKGSKMTPASNTKLQMKR